MADEAPGDRAPVGGLSVAALDRAQVGMLVQRVRGLQGRVDSAPNGCGHAAPEHEGVELVVRSLECIGESLGRSRG